MACSNYRKCSHFWGFSHHVHPLFDLTQNDIDWKWGSNKQPTFDTLKWIIITVPVLVLSDNSRLFQIEADSSDFATGTVLSQQSLNDRKWHSITFLSKFLSPVECNYKIHDNIDKEMLAVVSALEEWRHFVEGAEHQFEIWTDHKNLEYL